MNAHTDPRLCRLAPAELAECPSCGSTVVNPLSDGCDCGGELSPISRSVAPGSRIRGRAGLDLHLDLVEPARSGPSVTIDRRQLRYTRSGAEASAIVESLPELEDLGSEDLDLLEAAAVTIVRMRFHARRRAIAKAKRQAGGAP